MIRRPPPAQSGSVDPAGHARALYLEQIKRTVANWHYRRMTDTTLGRDPRDEGRPWRSDFVAEWREPRHTMASFKRLDGLQYCVENVLANDVPGDLIETGTWRGGAAILMRAVLAAYQVRDRMVWVADSFRGLPSPDATKYPDDRGVDMSGIAELSVTLEQVRSHFERYGLLDDQVRFLEGWFRDTLPSAPIGKIAVIRLDGDLYESTLIALESLYPRLSVGGWLIVDDYGALLPCRRAVHDYRAANGIVDPIIAVDWTEVRWRRSGNDRVRQAPPSQLAAASSG